MRIFRLMLIEQVNGTFKGNENIRDIVEFELDDATAKKNIFDIAAQVAKDFRDASEEATIEEENRNSNRNIYDGKSAGGGTFERGE